MGYLAHLPQSPAEAMRDNMSGVVGAAHGAALQANMARVVGAARGAALETNAVDALASTHTSVLLAAKDSADSKHDRWHLLNELDRISDPAVRHRVLAKFQGATGESLHDFVASADWQGDRDQDQALALISPERDAIETAIAHKTPDARAKLTADANGWAQEILNVTTTGDANDDENAQKIARVVGKRTQEEVEAIRAAVRLNTHGEHSIYEELDRALSGGNEDEAVAGLKGDPVASAAAGLQNADGDPARTKEILRGLSAAQLAGLKVREAAAGTAWIGDSVDEGPDRDEVVRLLAGDIAGADGTYFAGLLQGPSDAAKAGEFCGSGAAEQAVAAHSTTSVIREFESKPPAEVLAARAAWDQHAKDTHGPTWDDIIAERFGDADQTTYLRINALAHGERVEDRALAVEQGMHESNQQQIEGALANPDLASDDPTKRAAAAAEQRAVADRMQAADRARQHVLARYFGHAADDGPGRTLDAQLDQHYQDVAATEPEFNDPFEAVRYQANHDEEVDKRIQHTRADAVASGELRHDGVLSTATKVYRAEEADDTTQTAKLLDSVASNADLTALTGDFKAKFDRDMIAAPALASFELRAQLARLGGDARPLADIERELAHDDLNANELRIDNVRTYGAKRERRPDLELSLQREVFAKQHSGSLEEHEDLRARMGGNHGTEDLAREQLAVAEDMLEAPARPFAVGPRELKAEVSRDQFRQIDANLTSTLEVQRVEKRKHADHLAKIFGTIGKVAALVAGQPELFALIDVATGLGEMAIKKSAAGEAYDPADDAKALGLTVAVDAALVGLASAGTVAHAATTGAGASEAGLIGERTAARVADHGATAETKREIVGEGVVAAAGETGAVKEALAAAPAAPVGAETTEAGEVAAKAEQHVARASESIEHAEQNEAVATERIDKPHSVADQIDAATGVSKGPEYEQFNKEMREFYANQEVEAANVTEVKGTRWEEKTDGSYIRVDSQYDARTFTYDNATLKQVSMDLHLRPGAGVGAAELEQVQQNAVDGVDQYYNFGPKGRLHELPNGNKLQVEVNFVDDPAAADLVVGVEQPGIEPATLEDRSTVQNMWVTNESTPTVAAHEIGHQLGLVDEYEDARVINRATASAPGVRKDGSLMGNFHRDGVPTELKRRSIDQLGGDIKRAEASRVASTRPTGPMQAVAPPAPVSVDAETGAEREVGQGGAGEPAEAETQAAVGQRGVAPPASVRSVKNSAGETVVRSLVSSEDELLAAAERFAGGSLDTFTEYKPNWWQSPDGKMRIEFNLEGHANVKEGPHVTVRVFDGQRHSAVAKIFIEGREQYK
jgi:hypothetical protein